MYILCFFLSFFIFTTTAIRAELKYVISPSQSLVKWGGQKVGGSQTGTISILYGNIFKDKSGYKGLVVMDMASIKTDNFDDEEDNQKLINHLMSDDFFKVSKYPTAKLEITKCVQFSEAIEDEDKKMFKVVGKITIRGVTKEISFPIELEVSPGGAYLFTKGKITLDRTEFNISYNSGTFFRNLKDKLIYDEFILYFYVKAKILDE